MSDAGAAVLGVPLAFGWAYFFRALTIIAQSPRGAAVPRLQLEAP